MTRRSYDWTRYTEDEKMRRVRLCGALLGGRPARCHQWCCTRCRCDAVRSWHFNDEDDLAGLDRLRLVDIDLVVETAAGVPMVVRREKLRLHAVVRRHRADRLLIRGAVDPEPAPNGTWKIKIRVVLSLGRIEETRIARNLQRLWPSVRIKPFTGNLLPIFWPSIDPGGVFATSGIAPRDPAAIGALMSLDFGRRLMRVSCGRSPRRRRSPDRCTELLPTPVLV